MDAWSSWSREISNCEILRREDCNTTQARRVVLFFSHTQHVDDPLWFFTTIAHQLSTKIDEYRKALDPRIQRNPALLTKGLDAQFRELIIEPFLELAGKNVDMEDKMVIIDGLDECNGDPAQSKIMELVAKSVKEHGDKIPLLWAFFSCPESHINHEFSPYLDSGLFSKVELPMSESNDGDIKHYLHDKLLPLASADTVWLSEAFGRYPRYSCFDGSRAVDICCHSSQIHHGS